MKTSKKINIIKKSSLVCALATSMVLTPVHASNITEKNIITKAQQEKHNEDIGFGSGFVLGAIVAGPIGAIVTGLIGVFSAKHLNVINEKNELIVNLNETENIHQLALKQHQIKIQRLENDFNHELLALEQNQLNVSQLQLENLLMSLQFSTGSSDIQPHYQNQINALVKLLKQSPDLMIDLSGYTDLLGSDELNHALSIARVNSVKHALINQGLEADRINLYAFGEQLPVVANNEMQSSFYDRRVVIKLKYNESNQLIEKTVSNN